ncbi:uncharacterized protein LOC110657231 [Hevea brasiliensis]|uniref:uncharacterized protein LOC110657231 n=1 Tax=Hevea brasiliensis TaxID=3981 RepID=UPI0025F2FF48|nr:uncharacterized protein LOC110657231 [Hevea brasiliensis]
MNEWFAVCKIKTRPIVEVSEISQQSIDLAFQEDCNQLHEIDFHMDKTDSTLYVNGSFIDIDDVPENETVDVVEEEEDQEEEEEEEAEEDDDDNDDDDEDEDT